MPHTYTLTEAKAKLSELISRAHFGKEHFTITRKGKAVAVLLPVADTIDNGGEEGLIRAKGALKQFDEEVDHLIESVYLNRELGGI